MNKKDLIALRRHLASERFPEQQEELTPDYCEGFNDALRNVEEFLANYFHGQD